MLNHGYFIDNYCLNAVGVQELLKMKKNTFVMAWNTAGPV